MRKAKAINKLTAYLLIISVLFSLSGAAFTSFAAGDIAAFRKLCVEAWKSKTVSVDISSCGISTDKLQSAFSDVYYDNLDLFYVRNQYGYSYSGSSVSKISFSYEEYTKDEIAAFNAETNKIVNILSAFKTDIDKIIFLHEYLSDRADYDYTYQNHNAYNCLIDRSCVCEGYARTFMMLIKKAGVSCNYISSEENNHAWNSVYLDGKWYYVDVTWDDTAKTHENLLMSEKKCISTGHKAEKKDWLINGSESCMGKYTSTVYDNAAFKKSRSEISYDGGAWYYSDGAKIFSFSSSSPESTLIKTTDSKWYVWNKPSSYYTGGYTDVIASGGRIYYNTPGEIRSIKTDGTDEKTEYKLTSSELSKGYIYDIAQTEDGLEYRLATAPIGINGSVVTYSACLPFQIHTHSYINTVVSPTCSKEGYTSHTCLCGSTYNDSFTQKKEHTPVKDAATKATQTKNGKTEGSHCKVCGETIVKQKTIYKACKAVASKTKFTYNGKVQKPTVTIKDSKGKLLKEGTDYTLKCSNKSSKSTGKYSVKVTFKGNYSGSQTIYYTISPKTVTSLKLTSPSKKTVKVSFSKATGASGYEIYYKVKGASSYKKLKATTSTAFSYNKLTSSKTYYFKVRAYKTVDSEKIYGAFTKVKTIKIK